MRLRSMASALICSGGKLLMMHRGAHKKILPNQWALPGGHVEPHEMDNPRLAALRELREETGITEDMLSRFDLRYVFTITGGGELGIHFVFIGEADAEPALIPCDEGTFHWLAPDEIEGKPTAPSIRAMMEHYIPNSDDLRLHIGNVTFDPYSISWSHQKPDAIKP